jgi:dTDP-4-amino-4,6-dideoxygalactose transaminase
MKQINHGEYMKKVKTLTEESLRYIIKDCQEAITAMPNGEKAGYYADEINYCAMELSRRASTK